MYEVCVGVVKSMRKRTLSQGLTNIPNTKMGIARGQVNKHRRQATRRFPLLAVQAVRFFAITSAQA